MWSLFGIIEDPFKLEKNYLIITLLLLSSISPIQTQFAPEGVKGKLYKDGTFIAGTTGADWTPPLTQDLNRVNSGISISDWTTTSWYDVDCCVSMDNPSVWEDTETGVPDCFCRDIVIRSFYKTTAFCMLEQACANALRDFNKVFGEGYMAPGIGLDLNTESPARTCGVDGSPCGVHNTDPSKVWVDTYGRTIAPNTLPSPDYGKVIGQQILPISTKMDPLGYFNKIQAQTHHWMPGDAPADLAPYIGRKAGDGKMDAGLMAGTPVYPGYNHSACCQANVSSPCCRCSPTAQCTSCPARHEREAR